MACPEKRGPDRIEPLQLLLFSIFKFPICNLFVIDFIFKFCKILFIIVKALFLTGPAFRMEFYHCP